MFKELITDIPKYFNFVKVYSLYKEELIQILILGILLIFFYLIIGIFFNYSLKLTSSINKRKKGLYFEKLQTIIKAFKLITKYTLFFFFVLFILNKFNVNLTVILTGAGFLGATIVLIFQNTLRDIFTGWIFFFEDLFREGEKVMINNTFNGKVIDFKSRFLVLRGDRGEIINLPYSQINIVHNFSRKRVVGKIILKFKRENLKEDFFKSLENLLKNNLVNYQDIELKIDKNFNLYENSFETIVLLKLPSDLREEINYTIKNLIFQHFADSILEIRTEI